MDLEQSPLIPRGELSLILSALEGADTRGVLVLGDPWSGKSTLLRMLEKRLIGSGRAAFLLGAAELQHGGDLGVQLLNAIEQSQFGRPLRGKRVVRTSAGAPRLLETVTLIRSMEPRLPAPVLLLDGLDESLYGDRILAAVEELNSSLDEWQFVLSSRFHPEPDLLRLSKFARVVLEGLTPQAAAVRDAAQRLSEYVNREIDWVARDAHQSAEIQAALEWLALVGGREQVATLATRLGISEADLTPIMEAMLLRSLVILDSTGSVALLHDAIRNVVISRLLSVDPFSLADLDFGSEEAERDGLLEASFVRQRNLGGILTGRRSIIIGDRGAGKSAIFRRLSTLDRSPGGPAVNVAPLSDAAERLQRTVRGDEWYDTDALRAAWIVIIAAEVASCVPTTASKGVLSNATDLRAALGLPEEPGTAWRRLLRAGGRLFGGTTLKFAVGPVNLEAQLPSQSGRRGARSIDVEEFLKQVDELLSKSAMRVLVMVDRIDEAAKYDRRKQQAIVQGLLQAEGSISALRSIGLLVFLRTDLFELYDIQEKNKLVSRTLLLEWSEEEWLQILVRRVLANPALRWLADRLDVSSGSKDLRVALEALFPLEVEGQPIDRWLTDSLRNGNGDVSPRLAVILLHLARDASPDPDAPLVDLPIFTTESLRSAMTKVSELCFSEIVNDFKVATSFVLNCRAGRLDHFTLEKASNLFDEEEGQPSEQVRLLERLGFLERVLIVGESGPQSTFVVPVLYTRCWDYA